MMDNTERTKKINDTADMVYPAIKNIMNSTPVTDHDVVTRLFLAVAISSELIAAALSDAMCKSHHERQIEDILPLLEMWVKEILADNPCRAPKGTA